MKTFWTLGIAVIAACLLAGCEEAPPANTASTDGSTNVGLAAPPPADADAVEQPAPTDVANTDGTSTTLDSTPAADENTEAVVAEVGFGAKGHYDSNNYIAVAVSSQFRVQEQLTLLTIKRAMQSYKALHDRYPETQEEFFDEIIKENGISLPQLPEGEKFLYDPELAKETRGVDSLRILRPKQQ